MITELEEEETPEVEDVDAQEDNDEVKEKPFPFRQLPSDLQYQVIEKLDFVEWSQLRQCSRTSSLVCDSIRSQLPLKVYSIDVAEKKTRVNPGYFLEKYYYKIAWKRATKFPCKCDVHQVYVDQVLTSEKLKKLYKTFLYKGVNANYITFRKQVKCEAEEVAKLAELLNITSLECSSYFKSEFFDFPIAQQLTGIYLGSCRMTDKQFLSLKAENIEVRCDTITTKAINRFLKEWYEGKRELEMLEITAESSQIGRSEEELVEGLPINPVWSPDLHETSIISPIPSQELHELWSDDPRSFYCMWRSSDIERCKRLRLNREQLLIMNGNDEDIIDNLITEDQYYSIFKICSLCRCDYCCHRKWLSTARLIRSFPRVYSGMMSFVKLSRVLLTGYILYTGSDIVDGL